VQAEGDVVSRLEFWPTRDGLQVVKISRSPGEHAAIVRVLHTMELCDKARAIVSKEQL
jgi:hypothetical protein